MPYRLQRNCEKIAYAAAAAALALGLLATFGGCRKDASATATEDGKPAIEVTAASAQLRRWPRVVSLQGNLMSDEQALIGAKVAGRVQKVCVDLGSPVAEGEPLAVLDLKDFDLSVAQVESQLAQARAKLGLLPGADEKSLDPLKAAPVVEARALWDEAEANLTRTRTLAQTDSVSAEELQLRETLARVARARYDSALNTVREQIAALAMRRAELEMAIEAQSNATVRAPFAGVVAARHVGPGVFLQIGSPVVTLVRIDPLRFRAGAPERDSKSIRVGQDVELRIEGDDAVRSAKVSRISPVLELASRSLVVEIDVPNPDSALGGGTFAEADVVVDAEAKALALPASAVSEFAGVQKAWVLKDGQAAPRRIVTGRAADGYVEILEGLEPGELVALEAAKVTAGPVRIVETSKSQQAAAQPASRRVESLPDAVAR
jgi:RND family efflux transporter MFP subunit